MYDGATQSERQLRKVLRETGRSVVRHRLGSQPHAIWTSKLSAPPWNHACSCLTDAVAFCESDRPSPVTGCRMLSSRYQEAVTIHIRGQERKSMLMVALPANKGTRNSQPPLCMIQRVRSLTQGPTPAASGLCLNPSSLMTPSKSQSPNIRHSCICSREPAESNLWYH
jgi:hypothetical protein